MMGKRSTIQTDKVTSATDVAPDDLPATGSRAWAESVLRPNSRPFYYIFPAQSTGEGFQNDLCRVTTGEASTMTFDLGTKLQSMRGRNCASDELIRP
jgi:hypothetical protein